MTDNLPAVRSAEIVAFRDLSLDELARVGLWLALSESGQETEKALGASAALRLFYVRELGLPPLATADLSVIKGNVFVGAKITRILAARNGYRVERIESTDEICTAALVDLETGEEVGRTTFTIANARTAGLIREKSAWKTHPARMLWARASKYVIDDYAPHVTLGLYNDDERVEVLGRERNGDVVAAIVQELDAQEVVPFTEDHVVDDLDADFGPPPPPYIDEEENPQKGKRSAAEVNPYEPEGLYGTK
jgi:hypothetical protein